MVNRVGKVLTFVRLYLYAVLKHLFSRTPVPDGLSGEKLFLFFDPKYPEKKHGVVAFILPKSARTEDYADDLYGPFGFTSQIDCNGLPLYGRDKWGAVEDYQLTVNPELRQMRKKYPDQVIVLAGVRSGLGFFPWPLRANRFILVKKTSSLKAPKVMIGNDSIITLVLFLWKISGERLRKNSNRT